MQKYQRLLTMLGMDTKSAIERAGSALALAKILGITVQAVYQWGDKLPDGRYWQLQVLRPEWFMK